MNLGAVTTYFTGTLIVGFSNALYIICSSVLGIAVAYLLYKFSWKLIKGVSFTSNPWIDRMTYKPYKGYNRFHSRKWNLENGPDYIIKN